MTYVESQGAPLGDRELALADLDLSPLELLHLPEGDPSTAQRSELEDRLVYHAMETRPEAMAAATAGRLDVGRAAS